MLALAKNNAHVKSETLNKLKADLASARRNWDYVKDMDIETMDPALLKNNVELMRQMWQIIDRQ